MQEKLLTKFKHTFMIKTLNKVGIEGIDLHNEGHI